MQSVRPVSIAHGTAQTREEVAHARGGHLGAPLASPAPTTAGPCFGAPRRAMSASLVAECAHGSQFSTSLAVFYFTTIFAPTKNGVLLRRLPLTAMYTVVPAGSESTPSNARA